MKPLWGWRFPIMSFTCPQGTPIKPKRPSQRLKPVECTVSPRASKTSWGWPWTSDGMLKLCVYECPNREAGACRNWLVLRYACMRARVGLQEQEWCCNRQNCLVSLWHICLVCERACLVVLCPKGQWPVVRWAGGLNHKLLCRWDLILTTQLCSDVSALCFICVDIVAWHVHFIRDLERRNYYFCLHFVKHLCLCMFGTRVFLPQCRGSTRSCLLH